jgi:hypothetical protein
MMRLQRDDSNAFSLFAKIPLNTLLRRATAESYKHLELLPPLKSDGNRAYIQQKRTERDKPTCFLAASHEAWVQIMRHVVVGS